MSILTQNDETRLRELANGMAKDVEDTDKLLARLGFTRDDYDELAETRTFKSMLSQATSEWEGAGNTHKRIKLKAAINVEEALPHFYQAMIDPNEPLSSKVKALEVVSRIGNLGMPENTAASSGQYFKLEINLGAGRAPLVIENVIENVADVEPSVETYSPEYSNPLPTISKVWAGMEREEL